MLTSLRSKTLLVKLQYFVIFFLIGLDLIMDRNCFDRDVFVRIFMLVLEMVIVFMKPIRKAKKEPVIPLSNKEVWTK